MKTADAGPAALIVATGRGASGKTFQPLKKIGNLTAVEWLVRIFTLAGAGRVVVVGGADVSALEKQVARTGAVCLPGDDGPDAQMLDSIKLGLAYLSGKCGGALITPVDVPLFSVETAKRLAGAGAKVAIPSHAGRAGHPIYLDADAFPHVLGYGGECGLAGAIKTLGTSTTYLTVADEGVLADVKADDLAPLAGGHDVMAVHPRLRVTLEKDVRFFGPGAFQLLRLVDETGSLRMACTQMGISYSKGWKIVEVAEGCLGHKVVHRSRGGSQRGASTLTAEGRQLLESYAAFVKDCEAEMDRLFHKHFGGPT